METSLRRGQGVTLVEEVGSGLMYLSLDVTWSRRREDESEGVVGHSVVLFHCTETLETLGRTPDRDGEGSRNGGQGVDSVGGRTEVVDVPSAKGGWKSRVCRGVSWETPRRLVRVGW